MHSSPTMIRNHEKALEALLTAGDLCQDCQDYHGRYYVCDERLERLSTTVSNSGSWS